MSSWIRKPDSALFERIEFVVSVILPTTLIVVGTLGNFLSAAILLQQQHRRTSTNIYLIFLCIVDMLSLYQWNLAYIMYGLTDGKLQIANQSLFLCKCHMFLAFYTLHSSAMFLTLVSLDRACLLCSRWYKQRVAHRRPALLCCAAILISLFALDGFLFGLGVQYTIVDGSTGEATTTVGCYYSTDAGLSAFFANQYSWVHLVIMYFVPFTVMFACTVVTVRKLAVRYATGNEQLANSARRNRRISLMLLLMCASYVLLTLPNRLCFSVFADALIGHAYTDSVFLSSNTLMYTRNALNVFFLYVSVYGFRRDVRWLLHACYARARRRIVPQRAVGEEQKSVVALSVVPTQQRAAQVCIAGYS